VTCFRVAELSVFLGVLPFVADMCVYSVVDHVLLKTFSVGWPSALVTLLRLGVRAAVQSRHSCHMNILPLISTELSSPQHAASYRYCLLDLSLALWRS